MSTKCQGCILAPLGAVPAVFMQFSMTSLSTGLSEKFLMVRRFERFSKKILDRSCISDDEYSDREGRGICWDFFIGYYFSANMFVKDSFYEISELSISCK